jgi:hypothetical protein
MIDILVRPRRPLTAFESLTPRTPPINCDEGPREGESINQPRPLTHVLPRCLGKELDYDRVETDQSRHGRAIANVPAWLFCEIEINRCECLWLVEADPALSHYLYEKLGDYMCQRRSSARPRASAAASKSIEP